MNHPHPATAHKLRALAPAIGLMLAVTSCSQAETPAAAPPSSSATPRDSTAFTSPESPESEEPKVLTGSAPEASATAEPQEILSDLCGPGCSVSGIAFVEHPRWGQIRVVTMLTEGVLSTTGTIAAVNVDDEAVLWSTRLDQMLTLSPAATSQDATGNIFINYDPGRYNGVIVLRPTTEGFDDLQTLPGQNPGGRFYYAAPEGESEEEVSIWQYTNDGIPDYATGTVTKEQFVWDGTDYVSAGPPLPATGSPDEPYAAVR